MVNTPHHLKRRGGRESRALTSEQIATLRQFQHDIRASIPKLAAIFPFDVPPRTLGRALRGLRIWVFIADDLGAWITVYEKTRTPKA